MRPDQRRLQQLQARVSELEDELQAWRAFDPGDLADDPGNIDDRREQLARAFMRRYHPAGQRTVNCDRLLLRFGDHPARVFSVHEINEAANRTLAPEWVARSLIVELRHALANYGVPDGIETVHGRGYAMRAHAAAKLAEFFAFEAALPAPDPEKIRQDEAKARALEAKRRAEEEAHADRLAALRLRRDTRARALREAEAAAALVADSHWIAFTPAVVDKLRLSLMALLAQSIDAEVLSVRQLAMELQVDERFARALKTGHADVFSLDRLVRMLAAAGQPMELRTRCVRRAGGSANQRPVRRIDALVKMLTDAGLPVVVRVIRADGSRSAIEVGPTRRLDPLLAGLAEAGLDIELRATDLGGRADPGEGAYRRLDPLLNRLVEAGLQVELRSLRAPKSWLLAEDGSRSRPRPQRSKGPSPGSAASRKKTAAAKRDPNQASPTGGPLKARRSLAADSHRRNGWRSKGCLMRPWVGQTIAGQTSGRRQP